MNQELNHVNQTLQQLSSKKDMLLKQLDSLRDREEKVEILSMYTSIFLFIFVVEALDDRINRIGDHTLAVEKSIRYIKGSIIIMNLYLFCR